MIVQVPQMYLIFAILHVHVDAQKYYYKKNGPYFEISYGKKPPKSDFKEVQSPKALNYNYSQEVEDMACSTVKFSCPTGPYPRSITEAFECTLDQQCPKSPTYYKCCTNKCFQHKICQKGIPVASNTEKKIITTVIPAPENIEYLTNSTTTIVLYTLSPEKNTSNTKESTSSPVLTKYTELLSITTASEPIDVENSSLVSKIEKTLTMPSTITVLPTNSSTSTMKSTNTESSSKRTPSDYSTSTTFTILIIEPTKANPSSITAPTSYSTSTGIHETEGSITRTPTISITEMDGTDESSETAPTILETSTTETIEGDLSSTTKPSIINITSLFISTREITDAKTSSTIFTVSRNSTAGTAGEQSSSTISSLTSMMETTEEEPNSRITQTTEFQEKNSTSGSPPTSKYLSGESSQPTQPGEDRNESLNFLSSTSSLGSDGEQSSSTNRSSISMMEITEAKPNNRITETSTYSLKIGVTESQPSNMKAQGNFSISTLDNTQSQIANISTTERKFKSITELQITQSSQIGIANVTVTTSTDNPGHIETNISKDNSQIRSQEKNKSEQETITFSTTEPVKATTIPRFSLTTIHTIETEVTKITTDDSQVTSEAFIETSYIPENVTSLTPSMKGITGANTEIYVPLSTDSPQTQTESSGKLLTNTSEDQITEKGIEPTTSNGKHLGLPPVKYKPNIELRNQSKENQEKNIPFGSPPTTKLLSGENQKRISSGTPPTSKSVSEEEENSKSFNIFLAKSSSVSKTPKPIMKENVTILEIFLTESGTETPNPYEAQGAEIKMSSVEKLVTEDRSTNKSLSLSSSENTEDFKVTNRHSNISSEGFELTTSSTYNITSTDMIISINNASRQTIGTGDQIGHRNMFLHVSRGSRVISEQKTTPVYSPRKETTIHEPFSPMTSFASKYFTTYTIIVENSRTNYPSKSYNETKRNFSTSSVPQVSVQSSSDTVFTNHPRSDGSSDIHSTDSIFLDNNDKNIANFTRVISEGDKYSKTTRNLTELNVVSPTTSDVGEDETYVSSGDRSGISEDDEDVDEDVDEEVDEDVDKGFDNQSKDSKQTSDTGDLIELSRMVPNVTTLSSFISKQKTKTIIDHQTFSPLAMFTSTYLTAADVDNNNENIHKTNFYKKFTRSPTSFNGIHGSVQRIRESSTNSSNYQKNNNNDPELIYLDNDEKTGNAARAISEEDKYSKPKHVLTEANTISSTTSNVIESSGEGTGITDDAEINEDVEGGEKNRDGQNCGDWEDDEEHEDGSGTEHQIESL